MKKGEATGPQTTPKHDTPDEGVEERTTITDRERYRAAWDAAVQRSHEESQRLLQAVEGYPSGDAVTTEADDLQNSLAELLRCEKKLQDVRLVFEQLGSML